MDLSNPQTPDEAWSISRLLGGIETVLTDVFPKNRKLWIRGEIQKISDASGHCYIDLVDPGASAERYPPVLKVKCWKTSWAPLKRSLADDGIVLKAGSSICIRGNVDFWRARGEVSFLIDQVDRTALLGELAKERAALIEKLKASGALVAQQALSVPLAPIVIGLVGSPGTEGFNDFLGQIEATGLGVRVVVARATVQGATAVHEVSQALRALDDYGVDLLCLVRGGGSKGDLAAFDHETIALTIASLATPVWTGIGHTGDESIADLVAHTRFVTPTACGAGVAERLVTFVDSIASAATVIRQRSVASLDLAQAHASDTRRRLVLEPRLAIERAQQQLSRTGSQLLHRATSSLERRISGLDANRRVLQALDPKRQLARGWTITTNAQGAVIRSISDLTIGDSIVTRTVDGAIASTISAIEEGEQ